MGLLYKFRKLFQRDSKINLIFVRIKGSFCKKKGNENGGKKSRF